MSDSHRDDLSADQFGTLFLKDVALMDVRAPIEFCDGAFPSAMNVPLLDDEQRHLVGTEYVTNGQPAAIKLGLQLATADIRDQRMAVWQKFISENPKGYLYCFRGGLRSRTTQQWLADAGFSYPLIQGGYKALRRYLLNQLERLCKQGNIVLLSGATGVGKTELINARSSAINLEGRANHRGSAFGKTFESQPAQIGWENQIIIDWLRCEARSDAPVVIEAESRLIGRIHVPQILQQAMSQAPVLHLQANMTERVKRLYQDYVEYSLQHYQKSTKDPHLMLQKNLIDSFQRIKKRLGGLKLQQMLEQLTNATNWQRDHGDASGFYQLIEALLTDYYDAQYAHYQNKSDQRLILRGEYSDVTNWLDQNPQRVQTSHSASGLKA